MKSEQFDGRFFARYYYARRTRVAAPLDYVPRARLLAAYANLFEINVRRVLDAGAGAGFFVRALEAAFPAARCTGVEVSDYACARYAWTKSSITDYVARKPFELVVCHDVLQYLDRNAAIGALLNLDSLCSGLLYFTVLTREDWRDFCDQKRTDSAVHLRRASWYRQHLRRGFLRVGTGVYLARAAAPAMLALDHL